MQYLIVYKVSKRKLTYSASMLVKTASHTRPRWVTRIISSHRQHIAEQKRRLRISSPVIPYSLIAISKPLVLEFALLMLLADSGRSVNDLIGMKKKEKPGTRIDLMGAAGKRQPSDRPFTLTAGCSINHIFPIPDGYSTECMVIKSTTFQVQEKGVAEKFCDAFFNVTAPLFLLLPAFDPAADAPSLSRRTRCQH